MHANLTDFGSPPPRLSPGVLALVALVHAGVLGAMLTLPGRNEAARPPAPLFVRMIDAVAEQAAPPPRPAEPAPRLPTTIAPPPPRPVAATPAVRPEAVKPARSVESTEAARPDPSPVPAAQSPAPATAPAAAPMPAPIASVPPSEAPKPAAPTPLPVTQPRFHADYLDNPKPPYPSLSRRMGEEGEVRLRVNVDPEGRAQQVEIYRSSGFPRLDQAAADTVRQWRFVPARQGDQPVSAWVIVPIQFSLRS